MAAVAILSRDNPLLRFPHVLWAFAALLAFNLAYHLALRSRGDYWLVPLASMAVNTVIIAIILAFSGGMDSYFWPMYLLPVFTSCLYLEARHVGVAVAAASAFLGCFYLDLVLEEGPRWRLWELAIKAGVLGLAGWVTSQLSWHERFARKGLEEARGQLDALAAAHPQRARARERFSDGILYDVYSQLVVLSGSAEILRDRIPENEREDLSRIDASARSLRALVGELLQLSSPDEGETEVDLAQIVHRTLTLVSYKSRYRSLSVELDVKQGRRVKESRARLQQSLLELLQWVMLHAREGSTVKLSLYGASVSIELHTEEQPDPGMSALFSARKWSLTHSTVDDHLLLIASFSKITA